MRRVEPEPDDGACDVEVPLDLLAHAAPRPGPTEPRRGVGGPLGRVPEGSAGAREPLVRDAVGLRHVGPLADLVGATERIELLAHVSSTRSPFLGLGVDFERGEEHDAC